MDEVNETLGMIEEVIQTQDEIKCRKNVFESLGKLIQKYPERTEEIQKIFKYMCVKYSKDFYKDMRWDNPAEILQSI